MPREQQVLLDGGDHSIPDDTVIFISIINSGEDSLGRMMYPTKLEEDYIVRNLTDPKDRIRFGSDGMSYRQMTLFDDGMFPNGVRQEEKRII